MTVEFTEAQGDSSAALGFPSWVEDQVANYCDADPTVEVCGLVLAEPTESGALGPMAYEVLDIANIATDPRHFFKMDSEELAHVAAAWIIPQAVQGIWHSHPNGPAIPSPSDWETHASSVPLGIYCGGSLRWYRRGRG